MEEAGFIGVRERNTTFQIGDGGKDKGEPWAERRAAAGVAYIDSLQSTLQGVSAQLSWCRLCLFVLVRSRRNSSLEEEIVYEVSKRTALRSGPLGNSGETKSFT